MTSLRHAMGAAVVLATWVASGPSLWAGEGDPSGRTAPAAEAGRRSTPFGSIASERDRMPQTPKVVDEAPQVGSAELGPLSVESVDLKYLSAKTAAEVFKPLMSPMGTIVAQEGSNSLILFDIPDSLKRTVAEIRKADRDTAGLVLESVNLRFLNAKSAVEVFKGLTSPLGRIVVQEGSNTLFVFDAADHVKRVVAEIRKADQASAGVVMETVNLRFLDAKNLTSIVQKMVTPLGSVSANEASNSLIVCDTPDNLQRILGEIRKADRTPSQILVEVVLLDVRLGNDTEIGINWDYLSGQADDVGYRQNFTTERLSALPNTEDMLSQGMAFNTVGTGGEISVITGTIRNVVHMIQQKRDAQIIASPRAMVVSGKTAKISAAQEIPYRELSQTSGGGQMTSTQFKDVGVTLEVTATLTDANEIFLKVDTEQSVEVSTRTTVSDVPVVDKRSESTSLLVRDGQIVIMGGLRRREKTKQISQIPVIGDLPLVGALFRSTKNVVNNAELVVLLSPHLYAGEPVPAEILAQVEQLKKEKIMDGSKAEPTDAASRQTEEN